MAIAGNGEREAMQRAKWPSIAKIFVGYVIIVDVGALFGEYAYVVWMYYIYLIIIVLII